MEVVRERECACVAIVDIKEAKTNFVTRRESEETTRTTAPSFFGAVVTVFVLLL